MSLSTKTSVVGEVRFENLNRGALNPVETPITDLQQSREHVNVFIAGAQFHLNLRPVTILTVFVGGSGATGAGIAAFDILLMMPKSLRSAASFAASSFCSSAALIAAFCTSVASATRFLVEAL
jgi:hypothetical protein